MNMLLVEDEAVLRTTLTRILRSLGLTVTAVGSINKAKQAVLEGSFSIILSDMMLPDGTGAEFHLWVVSHFPERQPMFFFCSGGMSAELREYVHSTNCRLFKKPFDLSALIEAIRNRERPRTRESAIADGVLS